MDIFSEKLFEIYDNCYFRYEISKEDHSESIILEFAHYTEDEIEPDVETKYAVVRNAPVLSEWFRLYGYEQNEDKIHDLFRDAQKIYDLLLLDKNQTLEDYIEYLGNISQKQVSQLCERLFSVLKTIMDQCPLLAVWYTSVFQILSLMRYHLRNPKEIRYTARELYNSGKNFRDELLNLENIYGETREYCKAVFRVDNQVGSEVSPVTIDYMYRRYCEEAEKRYYKEQPVLASSGTMISWKEAFGGPLDTPWEAFYLEYKSFSSFDEGGASTPQMASIEEIALAGIHYLLETESVLRTCKLCGKTFRTKYTSSQEYCTRLYGDTKAACNEYASRKSYKEKLFQHPIHQEFTKAYNKLYGRIRRGKLPADTPLMEQLKRLHEEYYEKYENTHLKEREAVWREYIEKNQKLLV